MSENDLDMRNQIMNTVKRLINEGVDLDKLTVRAIAREAGVGTGLINYHFGSKDKLLEEALVENMSITAKEYLLKELADESMEPVEKLKHMLKCLFTFSIQYENMIRFLIIQCIQHGNVEAELTLIPLLRQVFKDTKNEIELRIAALQIIAPIQKASMDINSFRMYTGFDLYNEEQRNKFIDILADNIMR